MSQRAPDTGGEAPRAPVALDGRAAEAARLVSYLVIAAVSAVLFIDAGTLPPSRWEPLGAGAFPRIVCGVLIVLCLIASATTLKRMGGLAVFAGFGQAAIDWARRRYLVFVTLALFALHLATVPVVGFAPSAFVFVLVTALILAPISWRNIAVAVAVAAAFSFGLDTLFREVFDVFLPRMR